MVALALVVVLVLSACGKKGGPNGKTGADTDTGSVAAAQPVSVTRDLYGTKIKITAHPIKVKGDIAALTLDYELVGKTKGALAGSNVALYLILARSGLDLGPTKVNLVDLPGQRYYFQLKLAGKTGVQDAASFKKMSGSPYARNYLSDKEPKTTSVSLYEAPATDKIDVFIGNLGLVTDVPIIKADNTAEVKIAAPAGVDPDIKGNYTAPLRTVQIAYSDQIVTKEENKTVTIAIGSDVLFATDKFDLSPSAQAALSSAVAQVKASAPQGEVQVVGHTDDVGETAYNQTLSEKRAQTVATALTSALGTDYKITAKGVGETQPAVSGASEAARATNRRVEITFKGSLMSKTNEKQSIPAGEIPKTDAPTVSGAGQWLEYQTLHGLIGSTVLSSEQNKASYAAKSDTYAIMVDSVSRVNGSLVATLDLKIAKLGTDSSFMYLLQTLQSFQGGKDLQKRGYSAVGQMIGAYEVALLTGGGRVYPLDFAVPPARIDALTAGAGMLSDTNIFYPALQNEQNGGLDQVAHITVIWPDLGQDTVDIEVPGAFRITDVPVK